MPTREEIKRDAWLWEVLLEGQYGVTFQEESEYTISQSVKFYPTKEEAIREIGLFKYQDIWRFFGYVK